MKTIPAWFTLCCASICIAQTPTPEALPSGNVAVAWNDVQPGVGLVRVMSTRPPYRFVTPALQVGRDGVLHQFGRRLLVVSPSSDAITEIDVATWSIARVHTLPAGSQPRDIAVRDLRSAYVSRAGASRLLKIDLLTGTQTESVDLAAVAGADGVPDMERMQIFDGRLFVQMRRIDNAAVGNPPGLAVIDLDSETLVDANPLTAPIDPIVLHGTAPRMRMQVIGTPPTLYVSATGFFFDEGGIEAIDLQSLQSLGLAIAESDGETGADLGAFVLVRPQLGYLTFSTDFALSSHLHTFTPFGGVDFGELHVSLSYFAPALAHEPRSDTVSVPFSFGPDNGVDVFDAASGTLLTSAPIVTSGQVTDLLTLRRTAVYRPAREGTAVIRP